MKLLLACLTAICVACATTTDGSDQAAADELASAEQRMLAAAVLRVDYEVHAEGAVNADLRGDLVVQKPGRAAIDASGEFVDAPIKLQLISDGTHMRGGNATQRFDLATPEGLHDGLLLGLVRMGILHNLAMLSAGAPPDATDGSASTFAVAKDVRWLAGTEPESNSKALKFSLLVHDQHAGDVTLWLDPLTGLPQHREQRVYFDHGEMRVSERYRFELDGMVGPCRFDASASNKGPVQQ